MSEYQKLNTEKQEKYEYNIDLIISKNNIVEDKEEFIQLLKNGDIVIKLENKRLYISYRRNTIS